MSSKSNQKTTKEVLPFVVMAKPVGPFCNLSCGYCYYLGKKEDYSGRHKFRMSGEMLEEYIKQYIAASPGPIIQFVWHGGEPTLIGLDFYKKVVDLQRKYLPEGWSCWNNIQTNGILLDDEWCEFLAQNHFDVGLSIDGTRQLHDEYRKDRKAEGTYDKVVESLKRLKRHGVNPDLLCTITSSIAREPLAVYKKLKEFDTGWIQFIPIVNHDTEGNVSEASVTGLEYGEFLCKIFDQWIVNDVGKLNIQIIAETTFMLMGGKTNLCQLSSECGRVLVVEHDGNVYSCDHFVTPENLLGNIRQHDLGKLVDSGQQINFGRNKSKVLSSKCKACNWLALCNGGCPKNRFVSIAADEPLQNYLCEGYSRFFEHVKKPLENYIVLMNQGNSPEKIMSFFRRERKAG